MKGEKGEEGGGKEKEGGWAVGRVGGGVMMN